MEILKFLSKMFLVNRFVENIQTISLEYIMNHFHSFDTDSVQE